MHPAAGGGDLSVILKPRSARLVASRPVILPMGQVTVRHGTRRDPKRRAPRIGPVPLGTRSPDILMAGHVLVVVKSSRERGDSDVYAAGLHRGGRPRRASGSCR